MIKKFYNMSAIKRTIMLWIIMQCLMWIIFGISVLCHGDAWLNVNDVAPGTGAVGGWLSTLLFIIISNLIICILIALGNIFVRFGTITPGILILLIQIIGIGWLAGANDFEVPFTSIAEANIQYLKIGLWETTAYILTCAVTLTKSLYISNTFPATKWAEVRKLKDIRFSKEEVFIILIGLLLLIIAAIVETSKLVS